MKGAVRPSSGILPRLRHHKEFKSLTFKLELTEFRRLGEQRAANEVGLTGVLWTMYNA